MRVRHLLVGVCLVAGLGAAAASGQMPPAGEPQTANVGPDTLQIEGIAAIVNDTPISFSDVRERARLLILSVGAQPSQEQLEQIMGTALEQLIDEKLQLQEAAQYEVEVTAADVDAAVQDMASQSGLSREDFTAQLLAAGINPASLEEQMRAEIAWRRVMSGLYGSRIRISPNQIDEQLERFRAAAAETQYNLGEIFLFAPDAQSRAQALEAANTLRAQLDQGAPFQAVAQRFSSAPTAAAGGDMGWVSLEDLDTAVAEAVLAMPGPGYTDPIEVDNGVYLLAVIGRRDSEDGDVQVSLTRLATRNANADDLQAAIAEIEGCDDIARVADADDNLDAAPLGRIAISELNEEAALRITATAVDEPTEFFESSSGPTVMYVCAREENVGSMPTRDQVENRLFGQQLSMISQRALRNLRREATIIRR